MTQATRGGRVAQPSHGFRGGVDGVYLQVRSAILHGTLAAGAAVSQVELAGQLGVSRTMLREALRMLQREDLVWVERGRKVRVAPLSAEDAEGVYCARLSLEVSAARLTIPRLDPDQLAELEGALAQLVHFARAEDYERWEVVHRGFHELLVCRAGPRVTGLLRQLSDHAERYRRLYTTKAPRAWSSGSHEHRMILDAALDRDARLVARRIAAHLSNTAFGVVAMLDGGYEPARLQETVAWLIGEGDPWAS
jgi:DNA-binding GntR family transcriptional regulator